MRENAPGGYITAKDSQTMSHGAFLIVTFLGPGGMRSAAAPKQNFAPGAADVEICVKKQWHEECCSCRQLRGAVAYAGDICRHIPDSCVACEQLQKSARKRARHTQDG